MTLYPTPDTAAAAAKRRPERRATDGAWMGWDDPADYEPAARAAYPTADAEAEARAADHQLREEGAA